MGYGMYPGMVAWWKAHRGGHCGSVHADWGGDDGGWSASDGGGEGFGFGGGPFGVRRPLRFLAYKLRLSEEQVAELAKVLADLKLERQQVAVDHRRSSSSIADALEQDAYDEGKVSAAAQVRVKSAESLRDAIVRALKRIHALLSPEQRKELAYLLRTGQLQI
jgi:Spy/CpxP family protein refolding chaperone